MADHEHSDYSTRSSVLCIDCGKPLDICAYCNEDLHKCEAIKFATQKVLPGYRVIPDFPDYMVNSQASVRHIKTERYCMLVRVSKQGGAMITLRKNGKTYTRAAQDLRDQAFDAQSSE